MNKSNSYNFTWGSQQSQILDGLKSFAVGATSNSLFLTDVTLACEGEYIEAHRLVLSLCSSFFKELFNQNERISDKAHGIVILSHVSARDLRYILQFMYQGEVQVPQKDVDSFLESGKMLKVEGLMSATNVGVKPSSVSTVTAPTASTSTCCVSPKPLQAKRGRPRSIPQTESEKPESLKVGPGPSLSLVANNQKSCPNPTSANVKLESCENQGAISFVENDDDMGDGGMVDDYGDNGADSDFGGNDDDGGAIPGAQEEISRSVTVAPSMGAKVEANKTSVKEERTGGVGQRRSSRKEDDSSSSSDDEDDSSDDDSGSTEDYFDEPPPNKKKRLNLHRRKFDWELSKTYTNLEEAKTELKAEKAWKLHYMRTLTDGNKYLYDCNILRKCPAKRYLLHGKSGVELWKTAAEHVHVGVKKKKGLDWKTKDKINELWEAGVKRPQRILWELKKLGNEPKLSQVASYVHYNLRSKTPL